MLRLLHIADLHLDRAFGGQSYVGCDGAHRRSLLRSALHWAVDLALDGDARALTIGGDLFELEHVTSDSAAFIARELGRLPCPVLIAAGNHDYSSPSSPYRTLTWPENVVLALEPRPTRLDLGEVEVWAAGYPGREMAPGFLRSIQVDRDGSKRHLLVVHAVDLSTVSAELQWGGLGLLPEEVLAAGFDHALLGHIHQGQAGEVMSWPGSPVALDAGEAGGNHGALWVEVGEGGVGITPVPADILGYQTVNLDLSTVGDSTELEDQLRQLTESLKGPETLVTCRLFGRRIRSLDLEPAALAASLQGAARGIRVVDASVIETDLNELAREPNARGQAIARLLRDGSMPALWAANLVVEAFAAEVRVPE